MPIDDLDISVRTYNILKRAGINTLSELSKTTKEHLSKHYVGAKTLNEINDILLSYKMSISDMKLYLCTWDTNYGLNCCVVSALNEDNAKALALNHGAWDSIEANEIVLSNEEKVIPINFNR